MHTDTTATTDQPSPEVLIQRARDLISRLQERQAECEETRRIPQATLDDLFDAGLFDILKPKKYGGYEMSWDVFNEAVLAIAEGCGSTGWVYGVVGGHPLMVTIHTEQLQDEVYADNPRALVASSRMITGTMRRVEGGYIGSGIQTFCSGCQHSGWVFSGGNKIEDSDKTLTIIMPIEDVEILDTWHALGMAGTGSHDLELHDIFIPDHRCFIGGTKPPGKGIYSSPYINVGHMALGGYTLAAVVVGTATCGLNNFIESMKTRASRFGAKIAEFQSLQLRIAEAAAEIHTATTVLRADMKEVSEVIRRDVKIPPDMLVRHRRDTAFCSVLAQRAIDRILYAGGANALFLSNDLQRSWRDVHAGGAQFNINWDMEGTKYGRAVLGLDEPPAPASAANAAV